MAEQIVFYTNPMSRGRTVRWMLEELRASLSFDYETVVLDYGPAMKAPEYLAINPMGKVPAITHRGRVVTEGAAICCYLADNFPDSGLAPTDDERAAYYRWLFFAAGPLEQAIVNRSVFGEQEPADQSMMLGYGSYQQAIDALDGWLGKHDYICGPRFTAADVYLGMNLNFQIQFDNIPATAALKGYADRVAARPAYQAAAQIDEALMPADG
ncbi:MAG: glutathione S-transferase family protein [Pseudomonadota bacterium]